MENQMQASGGGVLKAESTEDIERADNTDVARQTQEGKEEVPPLFGALTQ